jgi:hypothetical protein
MTAGFGGVRIVAALRAGCVCGVGGFGKAAAWPPHSKMGWAVRKFTRLRNCVWRWLRVLGTWRLTFLQDYSWGGGVGMGSSKLPP